METESVDAVWLTEDHQFSIAKLAELSDFSEADLRELVEFSVITPINPDSPHWIFQGKCLVTVRTACRLCVSFDLAPTEVALVMSLLDRIEDLETQLAKLRAQLPQSIR